MNNLKNLTKGYTPPLTTQVLGELADEVIVGDSMAAVEEVIVNTVE